MRAKGFSLIELMLVIAVFALLIMAVAPSVSAWGANLRIRNTADAVQRGIQLARQEAVRRNQSVSFFLVSAPSANATQLDATCALSSTSGSWVVSVGSPAGKCNENPSTTIAPMLVSSYVMGDGGGDTIAVSALQADKSTVATTLTFNGLGRVTPGVIAGTGPIARISVGRSGSDSGNYRNLCVEVSGIGDVRMCDPALASSDPRACLAACQ